MEQQISEGPAELQASNNLLRAIIDSSPDMIQVFKAVRNEAGEIVDFRWLLNNRTSERNYGEVRGESLLQRNPGVVEEGIFDAFKRVTETGAPEIAERRYAHEQFDGWFLQSVVKLEDGVATTTKEITDWKAAQAEVLRLREAVAQGELRESEERYRTLFESIDQGFCVIEVLFDEAQRPVDYRFLEVNPAFERQTGLRDPAGKRMRELASEHEEHWFEAYGRIALTGEPARFENRAQALNGRWYEVHAFRVGEPAARRVAVLFDDVTERKRSQDALRDSEARHALLVRLSDALRTLTEPAEIEQAAMRLLGEHLGLSRCYYFQAVRENGGWVHVIEAAYQREPGGPSMVGRHILKDFGDERFEGFARGEAIAVADVGALPAVTPDQLASYRALGVTAFINVPLLRNGEYSAGIGAHDTRPHVWDGEVELIREVAARTWTAIEHARAEAALRESEERYRSLFDAVSQGIAINTLVRDSDGRVVDAQYLDLNAAYEAQTGFKRAAAIGRLASEIFPLVNPLWLETAERVVETGQPERFEDFVSDNGRWFAFNMSPFEGRDRFAVLYEDITERKRSEAALRETEERFRQFAENSADTLWIVDAQSQQLEYLSPAFDSMWGESRERVMADISRWSDLVHPHDRAAAAVGMPKLLAGQTYSQEYRIICPSDGSICWIRDTGFPIRDASGRVRRVAGIAQDVSESRRLAEHQRLLLAELQHRVRNTLGVIRSVARRTAQTSESVEDYAMHLEGRIDAFARVQGAVTREPTGGVDLEYLVAEELLAYRAHEGRQVLGIKGPKILLQPKAAENIALAVHELATNAVKYGALSQPKGRVEVSWTIQRDGEGLTLVFRWVESGIKLDGSAPRRRGFGMELLERTLAYDLKARATLDFAERGLICVVEIPLTDRVLVSERRTNLPREDARF